MKYFATPVLALSLMLSLMLSLSGIHAAKAQQPRKQEPQMIVRISEIKIDAQHLAQYQNILKEEAEASVRLEPGVLAIFPMVEKDSDTEFRILEVYANREAYEAHLKTPHFQKYKSGTVHMVQSLKLVDMQPIDAETMSRMFKKIK